MKRCLACAATFESPDWRCPACGAEPGGNSYPSFAPELAHSAEDYPLFAFEGWREFEQANRFWFAARERLIGWALNRFFPRAASLLELGCGVGSVLAYVASIRPDLELWGGDAAERALELASQRVPQATLLQLDARRLPFDGHFDVVGAFDVIEHLEEDEAVLAELRRATRPGGGVLLTVPQHPWLWSGFDEFSGHKRRYTRRELEAKVGAAGLEVLRVTSFVSLALPALAVTRKLTGRRRDYRALLASPAPPPLAGVLERLLMAEAAAIRRGRSLPVGGSLLLAACRAAA